MTKVKKINFLKKQLIKMLYTISFFEIIKDNEYMEVSLEYICNSKVFTLKKDYYKKVGRLKFYTIKNKEITYMTESEFLTELIKLVSIEDFYIKSRKNDGFEYQKVEFKEEK